MYRKCLKIIVIFVFSNILSEYSFISLIFILPGFLLTHSWWSIFLGVAVSTSFLWPKMLNRYICSFIFETYCYSLSILHIYSQKRYLTNLHFNYRLRINMSNKRQFLICFNNSFPPLHQCYHAIFSFALCYDI